MTQKEYEKMKDSVKKMFELLTYEEQKQIVERVKVILEREDRK